MTVLLFGATGMVGQGVLRECLLDPSVERVISVSRRPLTGWQVPSRSMNGIQVPSRRAVGKQVEPTRHKEAWREKLLEIVQPDVTRLYDAGLDLTAIDACFFCLGVSSLGMAEERYVEITYKLTLDVARILAQETPNSTFIYVSGTGTDTSESGRVMWARVKGRTENALLRLAFEAYMIRPGVIIPMHGVASSTRWTRLLYRATKPILPLMQALFPNHVTTTERVGKAMLYVARHGYEASILETKDINAAAKRS